MSVGETSCLQVVDVSQFKFQRRTSRTLFVLLFEALTDFWSFFLPMFTRSAVSRPPAGHLSPTETDGDMLGYDLYSSALADILSEPTMQPPICVGLYAQWGSGKSFLLKKLEGESTHRDMHTYLMDTCQHVSSSSDEMKTFAGQQIEPLFQFSWLVVFLSLLFCGSVVGVLGFTVDPKLALAVSLSLLALLYLFFGESLTRALVLSQTGQCER